MTKSARLEHKQKPAHHRKTPKAYQPNYIAVAVAVAVGFDLPESSIPFSKSCQRLAEAPWKARRALPHRMCDQRVPVDDMILKIAEGNP